MTKNHATVTANSTANFHEMGGADEVDREFVSLFEQIFKNVGIKQYNVMEFINYIFEMIKEDTKKFEQEK
jgi:hypothetical protein